VEQDEVAYGAHARGWGQHARPVVTVAVVAIHIVVTVDAVVDMVGVYGIVPLRIHVVMFRLGPLRPARRREVVVAIRPGYRAAVPG
jgi:hypothetical protein